VRLAESEALVNTVDQIRGLETVATAIASATAQWQGVHEKAAEAAGSARQVSEKMNTEMQSFMEFFEKANHSERQHLTLEVEKLKRAEADWLGVLVRILDHVFAIHGAARRAGQQKFADQLAQLQFACRDAARRVGLTPHEAERGELFDSKQHQVSGPGEVPEGARVAETLACGFTFRGQMIRPAAVALAGPSGAAEADGPRSRSEPVDAGSSSGEAPTQQELPTASS
jgi:molecular chaperone GrpE (heat shock protein)